MSSTTTDTMTTEEQGARAVGLLWWILWCRHHAPTGDTVTITIPAETVERIEQLTGQTGEDLWS